MTGRLLAAASGAVLLFNILPLLVVIPVSLNGGPVIDFPPHGLSLTWYARALGSEDWREAALVSLLLALAVGAVFVSICFAAAWTLTRHRFSGAAMFEMLLLSPLLLPQAVTALVLFWTLGAAGWRGTLGGIALAHVVLCIPFAYRPLAASLRQTDRAVEEAAAILGAAPWRVFIEVVLPAMRPALLVAFLFTALLSFDEVNVTAFLVSIDRVTLPVAILQASQDETSPLLSAIATMLILVTAAILAIAQRLAGTRSWSAALH